MKKHLIIISYFLLASLLFSQQETKTTSANINFRETPDLGGKVICVIPKGTALLLDFSLQEYRNWSFVKYNGVDGYVYSKYLVSYSDYTIKNFNSTRKTSTTNQQNNRSRQNTNSENYYINLAGERVQSPTYYNSAPAGATAECWDGTYSFSRSRRGTCSHHGGVKRWLR